MTDELLKRIETLEANSRKQDEHILALMDLLRDVLQVSGKLGDLHGKLGLEPPEKRVLAKPSQH